MKFTRGFFCYRHRFILSKNAASFVAVRNSLVLGFYPLFKLGGVMPAVICFLNVVTRADALMIVRGADFLSIFDKPQRDALVMLLLRLDHQFSARLLPAGAWLFPLGFWPIGISGIGVFPEIIARGDKAPASIRECADAEASVQIGIRYHPAERWVTITIVNPSRGMTANSNLWMNDAGRP